MENSRLNRTGVDHSTGKASVATLYFHDKAVLDGLLDALRSEPIALRNIDDLADCGGSEDGPAVLVLDAASIARFGDVAPTLPGEVVVVAADEDVASGAYSQYIALTLPQRGSTTACLRVLRAAWQLAAARVSARRNEHELARTRHEIDQLHRVGIALMSERDPHQLLHLILEQARSLTQSDAGSLYLVEKDEHGEKLLRFALAQNDTLPNLPLVQFSIPIDPASLAGYAACNGEPLALDDAYAIPAGEPYAFNRSFDERSGYHTRSMLVVPMMNHRDQVVGVLQLLNRKRERSARITSAVAADEFVQPYDAHEVMLVQSLAAQAAVSIENSHLYGQIETLFESFVKAAVTAIDQRDPTTAGHSIRVATLTVDLAQALERGGSGAYRNVSFSREQIKELRYAAMLHDFGKVGVREEVLVKSKKLPPFLWERVQARFDLIRRSAEAAYYRRRADLLIAHAADPKVLQEIEAEFNAQLARLDKFHEAVHAANEPTVLPEAAAGILDEIAQQSFVHVDGRVLPFLSRDELHFLKIPKGTLDERERLEIESHVEQTFRFLTQIPWTDNLQNLAIIAYGHHEKLNGRGYPRGVTAEQIPIQTRMMTVADIFDALTASDRPYKRALSADRAINILQSEAKDGLIDQDLVNVLIEAEVYKKVLEQDWRAL